MKRIPEFRSRTFWLLQAAGWGAYGFSTFLTVLPGADPAHRGLVFAFKAVVRPLTGILVSCGLVVALRYLGRDRAIGGGLLPVLGLSVVAGLIWSMAANVLAHPLRPAGTPVIDWAHYPSFVLDYVFVMLAWSACWSWLRNREAAQQSEREASAARSQARDAQLRMLSYQLHPHFLFNVLSSLRGLIRRDPKAAAGMVTNLAAFLRYGLEQSPSGQTTLGEELDVVRSYIDLERQRLAAGLEASFEIEPELERMEVPAFLLLPLVENAVKHAEPPDGEPLSVVVRAAARSGRLRMEVWNPGRLDGPGADSRDGTGTGLANVRGRIAALGPGRGAFRLTQVDGRVCAAVELDTGGDRTDGRHG